MITYWLNGSALVVKLDGKTVGRILPVLNGYCYFAKGQRTGGDVFKTIQQCKKSLEVGQ